MVQIRPAGGIEVVFPILSERWHDALGDQHGEPADAHIEVLGELLTVDAL